MKIDRIEAETELKCPECEKMVTAEQYDAFTESMCLTREQRRHYRSIIEVKNRNVKRKKDMYFCCPYCERWSLADTIRPYEEEEA